MEGDKTEMLSVDIIVQRVVVKELKKSRNLKYKYKRENEYSILDDKVVPAGLVTADLFKHVKFICYSINWR